MPGDPGGESEVRGHVIPEDLQTPATGQRGAPLVVATVVASVALHVLLVGALVWISGVEAAKIDLTQKPVRARLLRLGTRDKKLLPVKPAAPAPPPPKAVEVPGAKPAPKPAPKQPTRPAKQAAPKPDPGRRRALFDAFSQASARPDDQVGDPDGDPDGDSDTAEEGERYFGLILAKSRRNYGITKTISPQELIRLKAVVVLYIGSTGELLKDPEIQKSSGNPQFDQDVILALRKAAPFGPPPQQLAETLKTVGIAIEATP